MPEIKTIPALARFDRRWRNERGIRLLGGVDEAGRGALAGPVVAACVVLEPNTNLPGLNDSKQLLPEQREALVPKILARAVAWGVGWATAAEIDRINILEASLLAAERAIGCLPVQPEFMLTDFLKLKRPPCPIEPLVEADGKSQAVAAASVLAKVARDRIMVALDREYPMYGFASCKGYGTPAHWGSLDLYGPSTLHRLTYHGVCFFDIAPAVWSVSHRRLPVIPPPCIPNWSQILTRPCETLNPWDFLPEIEWEAVRHAPGFIVQT